MRLFTAIAIATTLTVTATAFTPVPSTNEVTQDLRQALSSVPASVSEPPLGRPRVEVVNGVVELSAAHTAALTLPGSATAHRPNGDLMVGTTYGPSFTTSVQDAGGGAYRALIHLESAAASGEFPFTFGPTVDLIGLEDGGVALRDADGNLTSTIAPPWAVDATGSPVDTYFSIDGNTITQHLRPTSATVYPVVADPFWIPALFVVAHLTRHVLTQAAARGISQAMIKQVVQNGAKTAGNKGTSVFTQGKGASRIRVIVDNKTGNIITATKG
ncbi:DUF4258 domain-containing protein [Leifsonia sp. RAF41]|uniref:DUF4258 domain-containing protein n=1 Tax=Leifsonia sp. RAF41 TaxID=3233056 RepID=UPI003F9E9BCB